MKNKGIFLIGLCLLVVGYMFVVVRPSIAPAKPAVVEQITKDAISVSQKISSTSNPSAIPITVAVEKGKTAFDLLAKTAKIQFTGEGINAFVTDINGDQAKMSDKTYWAFYINGVKANVGAGLYTLVDGDKIEWKLEKY